MYGPGCRLPVGEAWLAHKIPTLRLVAADAISLLPSFNDGIAVNRMFAIERLLQVEEYSPLAPSVTRAAQIEQMRGNVN